MSYSYIIKLPLQLVIAYTTKRKFKIPSRCFWLPTNDQEQSCRSGAMHEHQAIQKASHMQLRNAIMSRNHITHVR